MVKRKVKGKYVKPSVKKASKGIERKQMSIAQKDFVVLESYRTARTNIIFSLVDAEGCKKVVVTSAMSGDGKTTTCLNLAMTFAQLGAKVLVIEADLRLPKAQQYLDTNVKTGLSDVLAGIEELENVVINKNGIDFIPAGSIPQNPAEILASKKMEEVMDQLSEEYEYIFIDTPPATLITDAVVAAKFADGVVLVVRQKRTRFRDLKAIVDTFLFADVKILGFVLNDADIPRLSYRKGGYNYYNYSYSYAGNAMKKAAGMTKNPPGNQERAGGK